MKKKLMLFMTFLMIGIGLATAQVSEVTGVVTSEEDGLPVVGASVLVKGTTVGTVTDMDGKFTLGNMPSSAKTLVISFIGMKSQEVGIKPVVKIMLHLDAEILDEVVVVGYGSAKKLGSVVGAVSAVGKEKIKNVPTANFSDALAGQVSGLSILSGSGDPTAVASIRLRGVNSINAGNTPLFVLDGAPISSSVFNSLNPNDIENLTVLKDAASTSIYGSRAANGVIVITSKKGKLNQKARVTLRGQYGFSSIVTDGMEMMDSYDYIKFRDMMGQPVSNEIRNLVDKYGINTNWRDEVFDSHAPTYNVDASINGGSDNISYYLSLNHMDQEGIVEQSGMRRETLRFNIDSKVNSWLKFGLQSNLAFTQFEQNSEIDAASIYTSSPSVFARKALPFDSPRYYTIDKDGNIQYGDRAEYLHYSRQATPEYVNKNRDVQRRRISANINLYEEIKPIKGLTLRAQQSVDADDYTLDNLRYVSDNLYTPMGDKWPGKTGSRQERFSRYYAFTYTNTAEYKFNIDLHFVTALLGQESIIANDHGFGVFTEGHTDNRQLRLDQGTNVSMNDVSSTTTESVFNSYFMTLSYNYNSKYFLDISFRRDGSSKFAPDNRWANFYSVGGMWNVKKESFLEDIDWLNGLSVKGSYGTIGNSSIGDYKYFGLIGSDSNYNGEASLRISQPSNYDLTWETVASANVGVSLRLFDRLSLEADFYYKKTSDMLMKIPYSYTTGYGAGYGNIGAMVNKGIDVSANVDIFKTRNFLWSFRANFNYNKNEITELFNGRDEYVLPGSGLMYKVGHSVGELYAVRRAGVDPNDGKQIWLDKDGNETKVYNEERDAVLLSKNRFAPWTGGFGSEAMWKGLRISADFAWVAKKFMTSNDRFFLENPAHALNFNQSKVMLNMWTEPGQVTDIPAVGEPIQFDDHLVENASFLRLKNLTVQYAFPEKWLKYTHFVQGFNVFFTGRNLWTITKFSGYDPEPDRNLVKFGYPNTKQFVFGVELTF